MEDTYLSTNGIRLHAIQAGPVDGPLVVLLHGFPEYWRGWLKQIEHLPAAGYRVLAPDQRGYNLSEIPKGIEAYRIEELVMDVTGLLDALGRQDCYLVGHDWGAAVAWTTALLHSERIRKLAILNVPHPVVMSEFITKNPRQMLKSWYIGFFQIPGLADWLVRRNNFQQAVAALRGTSRPGTFSNQDIAEYQKAWQNSDGMTGMINWYRALARYRLPTLADIRLHMPVQILWGKNDRFLSYEMAEASARLCDDVQLTYFEDTSHWVQHEKAPEVNRALVTFFSSTD